MIINNCLNILCELSEIEKTISEIERLMQQHGIEIDSEDKMKTLIQIRLNSLISIQKS